MLFSLHFVFLVLSFASSESAYVISLVNITDVPTASANAEPITFLQKIAEGLRAARQTYHDAEVFRVQGFPTGGDSRDASSYKFLSIDMTDL